MKVLVATEKPFAPVALNQIMEITKNAGYEFSVLEKYTEKGELLSAVSDADALIVRSDLVTSDVLAEAKNLKIVVRAGAGYDNVDLNAASLNNVVVMNTPGQNSNAVAELAIGMMIFMARGKFNGKPGTELKGKRLGIHAYGNVGKIVGKIAKGFGMNVGAFDPYILPEIIKKDDLHVFDSAEDLYNNSEYISLHIPANEETKNSINYSLMKSMPENGTLINTARKEVINEEDLLKVLKERQDFKYASDIAPNNSDQLLANFESQCYFTPKKMGAQTAEANINAGIAAINQIIAFFKDGDTTFQVNK
jgi:D-3-phosphoglycerate dehydrogenase